MTFRDPLTSLPADAITSGTFNGTYRNTGTFVLAGTPGASRIEASGTELAFYAADGTTKLIDMDTSSGTGRIQSAIINGSTITGGLIQTAAAGARVYLDGVGQVLGLGIGAGQYDDGGLIPSQVVSGSNGYPILTLRGITQQGNPDAPVITLTGAGNGFPQTILGLTADLVRANGFNVMTGTGGVATGTTDANGRIIVNHGLGQVPSRVFTSPAATDGGSPILGYLLTPQASWTSMTFTARAVSTAGAAIASTSITFSWEVRP